MKREKLILAISTVILLFALLAGGVSFFWWQANRMRRVELPPGATTSLKEAFREGAMTSESCRSCHAEIFETWRQSHHAHANRPLLANRDREAFVPEHTLSASGLTTKVFWKSDRPAITAPMSDGSQQTFHPEMVLAYTPLQQFLIPFEGGRWQVTEWAWDPSRKDWFNVFGPAGRHPNEWGSWAGRGMNWNANCATCHMTAYDKGYSIASDSYASRWNEMGVSCLQCHAVTEDHLKNPAAPLARHNWDVKQDNCAACHSRREEMYPGFGPDSEYDNHYRLALPVTQGLYYPDGQVRDEDFEYGSFLMSKMGGRAGVTCLDCHNAHSGATKLPAANNSTCLSCHSSPGQRGAIVIDPLAHGHHKPDSAGSRCIECHMTQTTYMERDPRRDHGFHIPDPLLTKELGIPNACNKCHTDQSVDWAMEWTDRWYGEKMARPERERTRAVARAYAGESTRALAGDLVRLAEREDLAVWRAALLTMAARRVDLPEVQASLTKALSDKSPIVRAAAVDGLAPVPSLAGSEVPRLLNDPIRLVRLRAAWSQRESLPLNTGNKKELFESLSFNADQPGGAASMGQWYYAQRDMKLAESWYRKAISWDRFSPPLYEDLALMQNASQNPQGALATLEEGLRSLPTDAGLLNMKALLLAEMGDLKGAETAFRAAVASAPEMARSWYNLGLLCAQQERLDEAVEALQKAAEADKESPDMPFALATVFLRQNNRQAAQEAARRALQINPNYTPASNLLNSMGPLP